MSLKVIEKVTKKHLWQRMGVSLCGGILGAWLWLSPPAWAEPSMTVDTSRETMPPAATLFTVQCAGCHPNGGNIIRRNKTLKQKALQRNGLDSVDKIAALITQGKGNMSAYGDRLSPEAIALLAHYVWQQAPHW